MRFNRQIVVRVLLPLLTLGISSIGCFAQQMVTLKSANGTVLTAYKSGPMSVTISAANSELMRLGADNVELAVVLSGAADLWPDSLLHREYGLFVGTVSGMVGPMEHYYCAVGWHAEADKAPAFLRLYFYEKTQMQGTEDTKVLGSFSFARQQTPELRRLAEFLFSAVRPRST